MRRSDQRRDAVFASYQRDVTGRPLEDLITDARPLTRELAEGVDEHREELDDTIAAHAKGWTVDRIAPLDLNVMRVALYEIEEGLAPVEVAINEAIEIAKEYSGADAPKFINGVLGAIARERETANGAGGGK
jgi:N utilization substance protein B